MLCILPIAHLISITYLLQNQQQDDITWPVGRTTMTLKMATEPEGYLPDSEVIALLRSVTRAAYAHPANAPLVKPIWFRDPTKRDSPIFTLAPPLLHRELTWKSVYKVAEALLEFYQTKERHAWPQLDFLIDDPKQGTVGTGVLTRGVVEGGAHSK